MKLNIFDLLKFG